MKSQAYDRASGFLEEALEQLGLDGDKYDHANQSSSEHGYGPDESVLGRRVRWDRRTQAATIIYDEEYHGPRSVPLTFLGPDDGRIRNQIRAAGISEYLVRNYSISRRSSRLLEPFAKWMVMSDGNVQVEFIPPVSPETFQRLVSEIREAGFDCADGLINLYRNFGSPNWEH